MERERAHRRESADVPRPHAPAPAPGKRTLSAAVPAANVSLVIARQVAARAGDEIADGKVVAIVQADATLLVTASNVKPMIGHRITPDGEYGRIWMALASKLLAKPRDTRASFEPSCETGADREAEIHHNTPTVPGNTAQIAASKADAGKATMYKWPGEGDPDGAPMAAAFAHGAPAQNKFWCSGFSIWTLAAAGYDVLAPITGKDGKPYTFTDKKGDEKPISLRDLIDGHADAVEAMALVEQSGMERGGSVGKLTGKGFAAAHTARDGDQSPRGAPGALVLARIGREIDARDQKPGDFAQRRDAVGGKFTGKGHAWQVYSVVVRGSAMFGQAGSPQPTRASLNGWYDDVEYSIGIDTDPALVGEHYLVSEARVEANIPSAGFDSRKDEGGDGGVHVTGQSRVAQAPRGSTEQSRPAPSELIFYGRLSSSRWASWQPAKRP